MSERVNDQTAVLLERNGRFFFYLPGTSIISSGENVEEAYAKFAATRRASMEQAEQAGLTLTASGVAGAVPMQQVSAPGVARSTGAELKLFLIKTCIVLAIIVGAGALAGSMVARAVGGLAAGLDQTFAPLKSIALADVAKKAADIAKDAQSLTKEQKDTLQKSIGIISRELGSIADAWRNPPTETQPNTNSEAPPKNTQGR